MNTLQKQVNALVRLCTAEKESERRKARGELSRLAGQEVVSDPEILLRQILVELGAPDHLIGHPYTVYAILLVLEDRTYINSITFGLYPQVAAHFDTTASRVERGIRHLIEVTWTRGDLDVLNRYFGSTVDPRKGKPTNGEFVARIANIVQAELRQAA